MKKILYCVLILALVGGNIYMALENQSLEAVYQQGFEEAKTHREKGYAQLFALRDTIEACQESDAERDVAEIELRANLSHYEWDRLAQFCVTGPGHGMNGGERVTYDEETAEVVGNSYGQSGLIFLLEKIRLAAGNDWEQIARTEEGREELRQFLVMAKGDIDAVCEAVGEMREDAAETPEQLFSWYVVTMEKVKAAVRQSSLLEAGDETIKNPQAFAESV